MHVPVDAAWQATVLVAPDLLMLLLLLLRLMPPWLLQVSVHSGFTHRVR
jgi:hypothetical protein